MMNHELLCATTSIATWAGHLVEWQRSTLYENPDQPCETLADFRIIHRNASFLAQLVEEHPQLEHVLKEVRYFTIAIDGYSCMLLEQNHTTISADAVTLLTRIREVNRTVVSQINQQVSCSTQTVEAISGR